MFLTLVIYLLLIIQTSTLIDNNGKKNYLSYLMYSCMRLKSI